MHTSDQKRTIGFGRRTRNKAQVTRIFKARASSRRSSQWDKEVVERKRKEEGKTPGKPIDVSPFAIIGRKFVKFPVSWRDPQPPVDREITPLIIDIRVI